MLQLNSGDSWHFTLLELSIGSCKDVGWLWYTDKVGSGHNSLKMILSR